jgi:hypothetical protein
MMKEDSKSIVRAFKGSPLFIVVAIATVVVFGLSAISYARRGGFWSPGVQAQVFDEFRNRQGTGESRDGRRVFPLQGEVYSDAERLREASTIAVGGLLVAANQKLNGRALGTVEALLNEMISAGAMPPGITFDEPAKALISEEGIYYVRYRRDPVAVEVLSVCKGRLCGPAMLIRLPDDDFSQDSLTYYVAPGVGKDVAAPTAFSSAADVIKTGWRPVIFKVPVASVGK